LPAVGILGFDEGNKKVPSSNFVNLQLVPMTNSCPDLAWFMILDHLGVSGEFVALKCFFYGSVKNLPKCVAILCSFTVFPLFYQQRIYVKFLPGVRFVFIIQPFIKSIST
jgi:hypothetical protein